MTNEDLSLMAHLMRRAGFGATREELEERLANGYEATVEELLRPEDHEPVDIYEFLRYYQFQWKPGTAGGQGQTGWVWRMVNTDAPLQEKMCLFWHQIFATGVSKVDHYDEITDMIDLFREKGLGKYRDLLVEVARNPAMLFWLDNHENHATAINENWGRELLELFTMGVGNYTEKDVYECSRAFSGWTMTPKLPRFHMGRWDWYFEFREDDHDYGQKEFLGHTGDFDGEDIIDIVLAHPATARFIARHLYSFFVADEVQVPAWQVTPPRDPEAIEFIANALTESDFDMSHALRVLFNSDFFKRARFAKVKNPTEVVVGTVRMAGGVELPGPEIFDWANHITYMGQELLNPPSVEGWHSGVEWVNSGTLMKRANFVSDMMGDLERPGVRDIVERVKREGASPESVVSACLELLGELQVKDETMSELVSHAQIEGDLAWDEANEADSARRVSEILQLIVATREYQFA